MAALLLLVCGASVASAMVARISSHEILQSRLAQESKAGNWEYGDSQAASASATDSLTEYKDEAYMKPDEFGEGAGGLFGKFQHHQSLTYNMLNMIPYSGFNPSLTHLSPAMVSWTVPGEAEYMVSIQHSGSQCGKYGKEYVAKLLPTYPDRDIDFVLLNNMFKPLRYGNITGHDARLLRVGDQVLMSYEVDGLWAVRGVTANESMVCAVNFSLPKTFVTNWFSYQNDTDVGVIAYQDEFLLLLKDVAVPISGPMLESFAQKTVGDGATTTTTTTTTNTQLHDVRTHLHNSINPLFLQDRKQYLGVTYGYDNSTDGNKDYFHRFFLMQGDAPFAIESFSPRFCIPSIHPDRRDKCEVIQRIRGVIQNPVQPEFLIVSYGILDCEAAIVHIRLEDVLASLTLPYATVVEQPQNFHVDPPL